MIENCTKRRYASERSARRKLRELKRIRARHHQLNEKCERRVYQCRDCRSWHLTSLPYED